MTIPDKPIRKTISLYLNEAVLLWEYKLQKIFWHIPHNILFCTRGCAKSRPSLHYIKYVVELDDIYTTGPTWHECVYMLKHKGHLFLPECDYCKWLI